METYDSENPSAISTEDIARFFGSDPAQTEWDARREAPRGLDIMQNRAEQLGMTNDPASYLASLQTAAKANLDMANMQSNRFNRMGPDMTQQQADDINRGNNPLPNIGQDYGFNMSPLEKMEAARLELTPEQWDTKQRMGSADTNIMFHGRPQGKPSEVFSGMHTQEDVYNHPSFQQMIYGDPAHAARVFKGITNQDFQPFHDAKLAQVVTNRADAANAARELVQSRNAAGANYYDASLRDGTAIKDPNSGQILWRQQERTDSTDSNSPMRFTGAYGVGTPEQQRIAAQHGGTPTGSANLQDYKNQHTREETAAELSRTQGRNSKIIDELVKTRGLSVSNGKLVWHSMEPSKAIAGEDTGSFHVNPNKYVPVDERVLKLFELGGTLPEHKEMEKAAFDVRAQTPRTNVSRMVQAANAEDSQYYNQPVIHLSSFLNTPEKKARFAQLPPEQKAQLIAALQHGGLGWQADQPLANEYQNIPTSGWNEDRSMGWYDFDAQAAARQREQFTSDARSKTSWWLRNKSLDNLNRLQAHK